MYQNRPMLEFDDEDPPIQIRQLSPRPTQLAEPVENAHKAFTVEPRVSEAMTDKERARLYRARKRENGLKAVKAYLPQEAMAYLNAIRQLHGLTHSDAISLALACLIRGEPPDPALVPIKSVDADRKLLVL